MSLMSQMCCPHEKLWDTVTILERLIIKNDWFRENVTLVFSTSVKIISMK